MKQIQKVLVVLFIILGMVPASEAHAYLDPGSGSMLLQLLMGGIAGVAMVFKLYWQQLMGLFKSTKSEASEPSSPDNLSPRN